jgi:hypothetical protein
MRPCCATLGAVSLLAELDAFFTDHHHRGELDAGVDGPRYRPAVAHPRAGALIDARSPRYFRTHLFVALSHSRDRRTLAEDCSASCCQGRRC